MTDDTHQLGEFEGRPVIASTVKLTKAGDGLSAALQIDPVRYAVGERVFIVIEAEVGAVAHAPVKGAETTLMRSHVLRTETATMVDGELVQTVLDEQRAKIEAAELERLRAREEAAGVQRLRGTEPWSDDELDDLPPSDDLDDEPEAATS